MCLPVTNVECTTKTVPQTVNVCQDQTKTECSEVEESQCLDELTKKCEDKKSLRTEQKCGTKLEKVCKNVPKTVVRPMNVLRKVEECKDVKEKQCMVMPVWKKVSIITHFYLQLHHPRYFRCQRTAQSVSRAQRTCAGWSTCQRRLKNALLNLSTNVSRSQRNMSRLWTKMSAKMNSSTFLKKCAKARTTTKSMLTVTVPLRRPCLTATDHHKLHWNQSADRSLERRLRTSAAL